MKTWKLKWTFYLLFFQSFRAQKVIQENNLQPTLRPEMNRLQKKIQIHCVHHCVILAHIVVIMWGKLCFPVV